ncbi:daunorubicin resistance protein DrrA family ABC transporter ATP-binding protein [Halopiger xanaduensis]|uniref:Daunorubicin resistance ABC transporter ATPase subunit n=1 Tax=Halopiger xanaduensis (strain DSM 18323 / JCM 14033 / SH-6) TaxID=797210 RepID=F8DDD1_HALXS|nr:daunorubicin resistance protein DrrA family ABC transporter ATP-binding protein [Halopiger xanaduensis]AEH39020.1 daunorubicin resistance ABC transporter ATPase subunit [Halopiger xanaduensis SH-6]
MVAIQVDDLTKTFGETVAVDELSFRVEDGELFGLLGPNGAGKSTLINMLVTLLRPTAGTATVNEHDIIEETAAVRNSLGIVFQEPALDEELTGEENLAFHARLYGMDRDTRRRRIDEIFDLVGLEDERDRPVGSYSGGMKRRLEIGRGLLHEPSVLFLDEPTVGLDARTRRDTWEYIQRMNDEAGVSIVLTTHYIEEAEQLCDRVAVVDDGDIAAIDTPDALKESLGGDVVSLTVDGPTTEFTRQLEDRPWVAEYATDDDTVRVTVDRGAERIADLVRLADEAGASIASIDIHRPNLETVFLSLTGSTIGERSSASGAAAEPALGRTDGGQQDRTTDRQSQPAPTEDDR